jgi:hypothetical protein
MWPSDTSFGLWSAKPLKVIEFETPVITFQIKSISGIHMTTRINRLVTKTGQMWIPNCMTSFMDDHAAFFQKTRKVSSLDLFLVSSCDTFNCMIKYHNGLIRSRISHKYGYGVPGIYISYRLASYERF